jgi:hypothetical protein
MKSFCLIAVAASLIVGLALLPGKASSHREAPLISQDPMADNTDLYAFVSPNAPTTVTMIANYIPLEPPASGPNFRHLMTQSFTKSMLITTATP